MSKARRHLSGRWALSVAAVGLGLIVGGKAACAADAVTLTLKGHQFTPSHAEVPAGERFQIVVDNQDDTAGEFESSDMKVEKIVAPRTKITVRAGPLRPGSYAFFDDYHPDTAHGTFTAVEPGKPAASGTN